MRVTPEVWESVSDDLNRYVEILASRGIEWGLIGPREIDRLWQRHVLNSLAIDGFVPQDSSVLDVGSGAGLPGIPLALVRPDLQVTLLEPLLRRFEFLQQIVVELGLSKRVDVRRGRAEDQRGQFDVVTARAVAPLAKLVGWCAPLLGMTGLLVALKGKSAATEIALSAEALAAAGLSAKLNEVDVVGSDGPTWVVVVETAKDSALR